MICLLQTDSIWITLLEKFGLAVVALLGLSFFVWKGLWPFLTRQIEATQAALKEQLHNSSMAREAALKEFLIALDRRDAQLDKIIGAIDGLRNEIRRERGK